MKKIIKFMIVTLLVLSLIGCGASNSKIEPDLTAIEAEKMLNDGENIDGKIVEVVVKELIPDSAFGYNIVSGEHLNFVSSKNPEVKENDILIVEVVEVESMLGSYIIEYKRLDK